MQRVAKHTHRLRKYTYVKTGMSIFFCSLPDCHFKIESALAVGKEVLCNFCDEKFILTEYQLKLNKPHCRNCGRMKVEVDGKQRYVNKRSNPEILSAVAHNSAVDLKSRLTQITQVARVTPDEDI